MILPRTPGRRQGGTRRGAIGAASAQIGKMAAIARDDFTDLHREWFGENRTIVDEGVKLAVLAARIDLGWKIVQEFEIDLPPGELPGKCGAVDAGETGTESQRDERS